MLANALVIFARSPVPGKVKTRLAAAIGAEAAADLYRAFLEDVAVRLARDPRWSAVFAIAPEPDAPFPAEIAGGLPVRPQRGRDLGERMRHAIAEALESGAGVAAVVGTDVPHLEPETVAEAFAAVAGGADLALVPAEDGGYALIAARRVPEVFDGVAWGGPDVLEATLARARARGLAAVLLRPVFDVDRPADLERLADALRRGLVGPLPATARALARASRALGRRL